MTYRDTIEYLISKNCLRNRDIYRYENTAGEDYFNKLFEFYSGNLKWNKNYGANPSFIVFYNNNNIYALAKKSKGNYIIAFDKGIIHQLEKWFGSYFDFSIIQGLEHYKSIGNIINYNVSELIEQSIYHFTFYHEFAHLIQLAQEEEFEREDYLTGNCKFDFLQHIEEIDADTFSGLSITAHLFQFCEKWTNGKVNNVILNDLISVISASVCIYIINLPMCKESFYLKESSHPHNTIRVMNIISVIMNYSKTIIIEKGIKIKINEEYILKTTFFIIEKLLQHFKLDDIFSRFKFDLDNYWSDISGYQKILTGEISKHKFSSVKQWNNHSDYL